MRKFRAFGVSVTLIADFGVVDGSGNAIVAESEVCVHEYGGDFEMVSTLGFLSAWGIGTISSGVGTCG